MVNVTVINIRSLFKFFCITLILVFVFISIRFIKGKINFIEQGIKISFVGCINDTLPRIKENETTEKIRKVANSSRSSTLRRMLSTGLPMIDSLIIDGEENEEIHTAINDNANIEETKTNVVTEEIKENNITPKYNSVFGSVKVKNESDKEITEDILIPNISLENSKDIIIFHTHTCESYTPSEQFNYEMTGSYRTTDLNYSVARVGTELEKYLTNYGYNVIHNKTYHDYPAYSGSYGRSLTTVENILNNVNGQLVIDLHRDAVRKQCKLCTKCKNR